MEEHYKDAVIIVRTTPCANGLRWRSGSEVKYLKDLREAVKKLQLDLDYDTAQEAERACLVFSKKWVDLKL